MTLSCVSISAIAQEQGKELQTLHAKVEGIPILVIAPKETKARPLATTRL